MAKTLDDIFNDDDLGILGPNEKSSATKTERDRLIESFEEINLFFDHNSREPSTNNMSEYSLHARLKGFRADEQKKEIIKSFDRHNLLGFVAIEQKTFDDLLQEDDLGLLESDGDISIFEFKHTPRPENRAESDFIAQRQAMPENKFKKYEVLFQQVHKDLQEGRRQILPFHKFENNLQIGNFYLLDGILLFLESADLHQEFRELKSGDRFRTDGRTVTIFENGTESNLLFRSLGKAIQKNGKLITKPISYGETNLFSEGQQLGESDVHSGWIYVLRSKSTNPQIAELDSLYKIGFSTMNVTNRIKNSFKEATYLFADVEIITLYHCYNMNTQHFEGLIHRFFGTCCLNLDIFDQEGNRHSPREWFVVPIEIIDMAINLMISGEIVNYKYDIHLKKIVART